MFVPLTLISSNPSAPAAVASDKVPRTRNVSVVMKLDFILASCKKGLRLKERQFQTDTLFIDGFREVPVDCIFAA